MGNLAGIMRRVVKSVMCGYAGAVLAGVIIGFIGIAFSLSDETVVAVATPTGIAFGVLGLSQAWWRPAVARMMNQASSSR